YVWIDASGEIGEVDEKGTVIAKTKIGNGLAWGSIERLRNGHYLVALGGAPPKGQEGARQGKAYRGKAVNKPHTPAPPPTAATPSSSATPTSASTNSTPSATNAGSTPRSAGPSRRFGARIRKHPCSRPHCMRK